MNILFYMPTVLIGGVRTVTEILSKGFRERGHNVKWLLLYRIYGDERDFPENEDLTYLPSRNLLSSDNINFYESFVSQNNIDIVINQNGAFDGVKLIDNINNTHVKRISVIHNNPTFQLKWLFKDALTLRSNTIQEHFKRIARIILYPRTLRNFKLNLKNHYNTLIQGNSHINVLSPSYIDSVISINSRIHNISAIANPNTYTDTIVRKKENIVLFVGRLDNRAKKINELVSIWRKATKYAPSWKLIIVGEGPDKNNLQKMSRDIPTIEFSGYQNPKSYYSRASILCMTSLFEGFPMTITEAMQHGCVPIAYDSFPAIHDIIKNGYDGIIVKAFNRKSYIKSLIGLIKEPDKLKSMSDNAIQNIQRFNRDIIIDQWESLIISLNNNE